MAKKKNIYHVNVDMKWSKDYKVTAGSESEAKKLAWERFKKNPPKNLFGILADKE